MSIKEHRIYRYISKPVRIIRCTINEIAFVLARKVLATYFNQPFTKIAYAVAPFRGRRR